MCFELKPGRITTYSADGVVLGELTDGIPPNCTNATSRMLLLPVADILLMPFKVGSDYDILSSFSATTICGWILICDFLYRIPKFDRRLPVPGRNISPFKWQVVGPEGNEKFAFVQAKAELLIWDLTTGALEHQIQRSGEVRLVGRHGVAYFIDKCAYCFSVLYVVGCAFLSVGL